MFASVVSTKSVKSLTFKCETVLTPYRLAASTKTKVPCVYAAVVCATDVLSTVYYGAYCVAIFLNPLL